MRLEEIWRLVGALNRTIDERKPWELARRGEEAALDAVLYDCCEGLRWLSHLLAPFLPTSAAAIHTQLGGVDEPLWTTLRWGGLAAGTQTELAELSLFPRIEPLERIHD